MHSKILFIIIINKLEENIYASKNIMKYLDFFKIIQLSIILFQNYHLKI